MNGNPTKLTPADVKSILSRASRCTEASLLAFDVHNAIPAYGSGCVGFLTKNGYVLKRLLLHGGGINMTRLKREMDMRKNPPDLLILTKGHAMAFKDGLLVDSARRGWDLRPVEFVWEVTR